MLLTSATDNHGGALSLAGPARLAALRPPVLCRKVIASDCQYILKKLEQLRRQLLAN